MIARVSAKEYEEQICSYIGKGDFSKPFIVYGPSGSGKTDYFNDTIKKLGITNYYHSFADTPEEISKLPHDCASAMKFWFYKLPSLEVFDSLMEKCNQDSSVPYFVEITGDNIPESDVYAKYRETVDWFRLTLTPEEMQSRNVR